MTISIKRNEDFIVSLFKSFNIKQYNFAFNRYGDLDVFLTYQNKEYKIVVDEQEMCLKLFKMNLANNKKKKESRRLIKVFKSNDVWLEVLKYLTNED